MNHRQQLFFFTSWHDYLLNIPTSNDNNLRPNFLVQPNCDQYYLSFIVCTIFLCCPCAMTPTVTPVCHQNACVTRAGLFGQTLYVFCLKISQFNQHPCHLWLIQFDNCIDGHSVQRNVQPQKGENWGPTFKWLGKKVTCFFFIMQFEKIECLTWKKKKFSFTLRPLVICHVGARPKTKTQAGFCLTLLFSV